MQNRNFEMDHRIVLPSETKIFFWRIDHFRPLAISRIDELEFIFELGDSIDLTTKWRAFFCKNLENEKELGLFVGLAESNDFDQVFAEYAVSILHNRSVKGMEFAPSVAETRDYKNIELPDYGWDTFIKINELDQILMEDGSLLLSFKFTLYGNVEHQTTNDNKYLSIGNGNIQAKMEQISIQKFQDDLSALFQEGENPEGDVIFISGDGNAELRAHRLILSARSPVFSRMFQTQMLESESGVVKIEDMSHLALKCMLEYVYTGSLKRDKMNLDICKELIDAGEKYSMSYIKEYCSFQLVGFLTPENCLDLLHFAKLQNLSTLEIQIMDFVKKNSSQIINSNTG